MSPHPLPPDPMLKYVDATNRIAREGYFFSQAHVHTPSTHSTLDRGVKGELLAKPFPVGGYFFSQTPDPNLRVKCLDMDDGWDDADELPQPTTNGSCTAGAKWLDIAMNMRLPTITRLHPLPRAAKRCEKNIQSWSDGSRSYEGKYLCGKFSSEVHLFPPSHLTHKHTNRNTPRSSRDMSGPS